LYDKIINIFSILIVYFFPHEGKHFREQKYCRHAQTFLFAPCPPGCPPPPGAG